MRHESLILRRVLYVTGHFTHPVKEAQIASAKNQLLNELSKVLHVEAYSPLGRITGKPVNDFLNNLIPRINKKGRIVYIFPPLLQAPGFVVTGISLFLSTLFLFIYILVAGIPDAIYTTSILVSVPAAAVSRIFKIPMVVNYGDPDYVRESGLSLYLFTLCETFVLRHKYLSSVVCWDENMVKYVKSKFNVPRVVFLPNGGHSGIKCDGAISKTKGDVFSIVYAGHIAPPPVYRLDLLIPTAKCLKNRGYKVKFLVIGSGAYLRSLISEVRKNELNDMFNFLGPRDYNEVREILKSVDCGIQLCNDWCMATKVIMYMANGVPSIVCCGWYDKYGEFLRNGENVLLVPPDPSAISDALIRLISDKELRSKLAREAINSVREYTWEKHAVTTLELLENARVLCKRRA